MSTEQRGLAVHPAGEQPEVAQHSAIADTFAGRVHVEWDAPAPVTPFGQLPFFIDYLKQAGLFSRVKLWKRELQRFANETGLQITVTHLPPGTSKWNKIEHRLFAFITQNWRGKPLVSHLVIVQLIGATTTETGLQVCCEIDGNLYPRGVKVTQQEMLAINITRDDFHGEWNYTISPNQQPP